MENKGIDLLSVLTDAMGQAFDDRQEKSNQYVVAIFNKHTDELLGYHLSTSCQRTDDKLQAKRYNGDNPYNQLKTISENLRNKFVNYPQTGIFSSISNEIRESYGELNHDDLYLDAVYLEEDAPKLSFKTWVSTNE